MFTKDWTPFTMPTGETIYRPTIKVFVKEVTDFYLYRFLVDSGADLSMAPYSLFCKLGKKWEDGEKRFLRGISPKEECIVEGRVHDVDILIGEISVQINISICFVKENVPFILGRESFFNYFIITFDKPAKKTTFAFVDTSI